MARAMKVLRSTWKGFSQQDLVAFATWLGGNLMPQMDRYVDIITPAAIKSSKVNVYGNW